ncbi:MAG: amidohydrolase family protein [Nitrososphaerales archaeon]
MTSSMIIDFSSHLIVPSVAKRIASSTDAGIRWNVPPDNAEVEGRLKLMKKYAVDMQVLSLNTSAFKGLSVKDAEDICKMTNDSIAEFCNKRPDKFVGLAALSLLDVEKAVQELKRAIEDLGFRGAVLATNESGKGLDSKEYYPIYERACKYDIPIFLHPTRWGSYPLVDDKMMMIFGWPFDTTQAVWRLIFGGVLDKFPSLKIVTHHLGGMLPYFNGRIEHYTSFPNPSCKRQSISEYWGQIYSDTAIDGQFAAFMCGYSFFGPERIVYGTDYPFGPEQGESYIRENLAGVRAMLIPDEEKRRILGDNCRRLLRIS